MLEKERQLKETERLYLNLRQVVAKQPGPEIQDQLVKTQKALTQRINKMKESILSLNCYIRVVYTYFSFMFIFC